MILRLLLLIVLPLVGLAGPAGAQTPELVLEDGEKELVIMRGPVPQYPGIAAFFDVQGHCDVRYSLTRTGRIIVTETRCSTPFFCYSAKTAVENAEMFARDRAGNRVERRNLVYPLVFQMNGMEPPGKLQLKPCKDYPVS